MSVKRRPDDHFVMGSSVDQIPVSIKPGDSFIYVGVALQSASIRIPTCASPSRICLLAFTMTASKPKHEHPVLTCCSNSKGDGSILLILQKAVNSVQQQRLMPCDGIFCLRPKSQCKPRLSGALTIGCSTEQAGSVQEVSPSTQSFR